MKFDFPNNPVPGSIFAPVGGPIYRFDAPVWVAISEPPATGVASEGGVDVRQYGVQITGPPGFRDTSVDPAGQFDNTAAINVALASGQPLYFPPGRYHICGKINCDSQTIYGAGRMQTIFDVGSDFNMAATMVIDTAATVASHQEGTNIHDIGIEFWQDPAAASIAQIIHYPPAIGATQEGTRAILDNILIGRAWDGLRFVGNYAFILQGVIQIGAFHTPFIFDGSLDYGFVNSIEVWPFGCENLTNLTSIFIANNPTSFINYMDGLSIDNLSFFEASLTFANPHPAGFVTGIQISNLHFNGNTGLLKVTGGGVVVSNLCLDVNGPGIEVNGPFDSTILTVGTGKYIHAGTPNYIVNHGGILNILGGYFLLDNVDDQIVCDSATGASRTYIYDISIHTPAPVALNKTLIRQSGAASGLFIDGLTVVASYTAPVTVPIIAIGFDTLFNSLDHINLKMWGSQTVSVALDPTGVRGFYNLPDVVFPITSTPKFFTTGNFAPTAQTVAGYYRLLGGMVQFNLYHKFTTNAYTTAAGGFSFVTNLPVFYAAGAPGLAAHGTTAIALGRYSKVTLPAGAALVAEVEYTNPVEIQPEQVLTGASWSQLGPGNLPASTADIEFMFSGFYAIR